MQVEVAQPPARAQSAEVVVSGFLVVGDPSLLQLVDQLQGGGPCLVSLRWCGLQCGGGKSGVRAGEEARVLRAGRSEG